MSEDPTRVINIGNILTYSGPFAPHPSTFVPIIDEKSKEFVE